MKKVSLQKIASSLGVSRTTVWKVFTNQDGVSEGLRTKILEKAKELNYDIPSNLAVSHSDPLPVNIAVAVCRPESSMFWMTIIHQIAKELSLHDVNLIYTYLPPSVDANYILPSSLTNGNIHGIIVMNVYNEQILHLLAATPVPKVFLDTATSISPEELNGDLILTENQNSISKITHHLIHKGKQSFGFIGDINYAKSNYERYEGFLKALMKHGIPLQPELMLTKSLGINTYKEEIEAFLDQLTALPDAFICVNDYVGCILIQILTKKGFSIPDQVSVSGYDGNTENPLAENLTTVQVFNQNIGFRLALQILHRIKYPDIPFEVIYIGSKVLFRSSTDD